MNKFWLILYTTLTSLAYTGLVSYFSTYGKQLNLGLTAIVLVGATALISLGRDKISEWENLKKIEAKDVEIKNLESELKKTKNLLHTVKSKVIGSVLGSSDDNKIVKEMRAFALVLNSNQAVNNLPMDDKAARASYEAIINYTEQS